MKTRIISVPSRRWTNYVVEAFFPLHKSDSPGWWPLRNLANLGDASFFMDVDVPKLSMISLRMLAFRYDEKKIFRRGKGGKCFTRVYG